MIHQFSCKNFYSFLDETIVSFAVNDKAPKNDGYFMTASGDRLSKVETVMYQTLGKDQPTESFTIFKVADC